MVYSLNLVELQYLCHPLIVDDEVLLQGFGTNGPFKCLKVCRFVDNSWECFLLNHFQSLHILTNQFGSNRLSNTLYNDLWFEVILIPFISRLVSHPGAFETT